MKSVDKIKVVCAECGKIEYVTPSRARKYLCCSVNCLGRYNSKRYSKHISLKCPICGKMYECMRSKIEHHRTCGDAECRREWKSIISKGENNPNYKTVEDLLMKKSANGEKHDKSRYLYLHIIKEHFKLKSLRDIPKGYVIHHKDGNHENNDIENLIMLPKSAHRLIHTVFGNVLINALHSGKIDRDVFFGICNDEQKNFYKEIIDMNITKQVIIKENDVIDNSNECDSVYKYIVETN